MRYLDKSFTLPAGSPKITQTDWEIAVGLRNPDGSLVQPRKVHSHRCSKIVRFAANMPGLPDECTCHLDCRTKRMERELSE